LLIFRKEKIAREANSFIDRPADPLHAFVGKPSRSALETMLTSLGWTFSYYDWHRAAIKNWHGMRDLPRRPPRHAGSNPHLELIAGRSLFP
jgi:hypothetical protein